MNRSSTKLAGMALLLATFALLFAGCSPADVAERPQPSESTTPTPSVETSCTPTTPNGATPPGEAAAPLYLGNGEIFTTLWPDGVVVFEPGGPGEVRADGSLAMKWPFWRGEGVAGELTIEGRSLHTSGLTVSAEIPEGYGDTGVQATALVFPGPGCFEVTARAGGSSLTFITKVERRD